MTQLADLLDAAQAELARALLKVARAGATGDIVCTVNGGRITLVTPPRLPWTATALLWPVTTQLSPAQATVLEAVGRAQGPLRTARAEGHLIVPCTAGQPVGTLDWQERLPVGRG